MSSPRPSPTKSLPALDTSPLTFKRSLDSKHANISLKKSISERYKKEREEDQTSDGQHSDEKYMCVDGKLPPDERPAEDSADANVITTTRSKLAGAVTEPPEDPPGLPDGKDKGSAESFGKKSAASDLFPNEACHPKSEGKRRKNSSKKQSSRSLVIKEATDSPDSSTEPFKASVKGEPGQGKCFPPPFVDALLSPYHQIPTTTMPADEPILCQVCGDLAAGFYCSAYICEACKKFFIRASKLERPRYACQRQKNCEITKESRVHCQYCRYQKCLRLNMSYPKSGEKSGSKTGVQEIPCRVCSAPSSGFHFGALTCEGCKGFFRRMVKEREAFGYKCNKNSTCEINTVTRNMCKTCRFNKCLQVGMSVEGSRIGRQPNAIKHAITLEAKKQIALKIEKTDVAYQDASDLSPLNFDMVVLDACQANELETNLKIPHEDCRNLFGPPPTPLDQHSYPHVNEGMDTDTKRVVGTMNPPHVSPSLSEVRQETTPPQRPSSSSTTHFPQTSRSPSHGRKKVEYSRSLSSQGFPHRSLSFSSQSPYLYDEDRNTSLDLSTSAAPDPFLSRSHRLSLPNSKAGILFPPSDISFYHFPQMPPSKYRPPHLNESELYKSKYPQITPDMNLYGCRESIQRLEHSQPQFQDFSLRDVKPCLCQDPKCRAAMHIDPHSNPIRYSGAHESPEEFYKKHNRKNVPADYTMGMVPVHRESDTLRPAAYGQHPDHMPFIMEQTAVQPEFPLLSGHVSHVDQKNVISRNKPIYPSPSSHIKPSEKKQGHDLHSTKVEEFSSGKNFPLKVNSHEQTQTSPLHSLPPTPKEKEDEDKSLDLSVSKTAHHPKLSCKETFSMGNVQTMMDLASKEIAHLCMVQRAKSDEFDAEAYSTLEGTWDRMMTHFHFHAKCIVRFAKKIPGFRDLQIDDQVSLLRDSTYVIVVLNHARSYEPDTEFYNFFNFTKKEKEKVHEFFPELDSLPNHFLYACRMAQKHKLTEMEYAFLSCLLLLDMECIGVVNKVALKDLRDVYMESFHDYEMEQYNSVHYGEILFCLPEFTKFAQQHNAAVGAIIGANPQLHIPQLYAEMYKS